MTRTILFLLILILNNPMQAQGSNSEMYVTAVAELIEVYSTGKRHDSHLFTFKIKKILSGNTNDSIFKTQEIFNDFGASDIFLKTKSHAYDAGPIRSEDVIIKYAPKGRLKWIAEKNRRFSLESLESLLEAYAQKNKLKGNYNMLTEREGKLFFSYGGKNWKVAVESHTGSGNWIISTIDE
ncbi:hypothetical protein [Aquimarina sp. SS2-1]|uniref:hypothetical protein n=1 Tax=Aquimarina besae TaxID=3342247 RepID=UPI00367099B7